MKALEQELAQRERRAVQAVGALQAEAGAALKKMEPFMQVNFESGSWKREGLPWGRRDAKMENSTPKSLVPRSKRLRVLKAAKPKGGKSAC